MYSEKINIRKKSFQKTVKFHKEIKIFFVAKSLKRYKDVHSG